MKNIKQLSRSEMKNILAGHQHNICSVEVTCPSGRTIGCTGSVDEPNLTYVIVRMMDQYMVISIVV